MRPTSLRLGFLLAVLAPAAAVVASGAVFSLTGMPWDVAWTNAALLGVALSAVSVCIIFVDHWVSR